MNLKATVRTVPEDESEVILAELVEQFIDRLHSNEAVDPWEFAAEHPEHAEALLALLPAATTMAQLRRSAIQHAVPPSHVCLDTDVIGDYQIVRELGRGGMGVVYEAEQLSTGRKVALKVLPLSSATDPKQIERFRIEAQAAAALDHEHIVPVYEIGCERMVHFYAMRFVDGCSLAALIQEARSGLSTSILGHREAAGLVLQAAEALAHAHELGILHRDIKPANLLLESTGHLWVADFGLARFLDGGDLTQTGDVIGTLRYLSPEQARGHRPVDPRADVYSLGATLYELMTLQPVFDGQDRQELLRRITFVEPTAPRRLDRTIPRNLETILLTAIAKESDSRYVSAREFADDLRRFIEDRPIVARRPGLLKRLVRWARRNKAAVAIAVGILALFAGGSAVGVGLLWREQVRTRENLRMALTALNEFCLSTTRIELTRDPERTQEVRDLQLKALTIYEQMLLQNPSNSEARWAAAQAEHRVANLLARSPRFAEAEPAYQAAQKHLAILLAEDPNRLEYRRQSADILGDWGASQLLGKPEVQKLRRRALREHLQLAREFPDQPKYRISASKDYLEVGKSIGIIDPAQAVEK
jgi:eukaryotic-like serine/threonine-protein kinase